MIEDLNEESTTLATASVSIDKAKDYFFENLDDLKFGDSNELIRVPIWPNARTIETDSVDILSVPLVYVGEEYRREVTRDLLHL